MNRTDSAPQNSKILLLHGALGSKDQFKDLTSHLDPGIEVNTFNFSGHGGKPFSDSFSIEGFSDEVLQFLKENNISETMIFGYSMGGYVALNTALKLPQVVRRIFTLGTKFDWNPETAAKEIKMLNPEIIEAKVPRFADALKHRHGADKWKKLLRKTAEMMTAIGNGAVIDETDFSKIKQPVTIGIGTLDNMVTLEESSKIADLLQNGTLQIFEGFKHPIEQIDTKILADKLLFTIKETNI